MKHAVSSAISGLVLLFCSQPSRAQFPPAGDDSFDSQGVFQVTLTPALGGATYVVKASGPTCVARSDPHAQGADPSGTLGDGSLCPGSPSTATPDAVIGLPFPPGFNAGGGVDEVHTEMLAMTLASFDGWIIRAGTGAGIPCALARSLGEVEARGGASGFGGLGADSFFHLYIEIDVPSSIAPGGMTVFNKTPLVVEAKGLTSFPPVGTDYVHSYEVRGPVLLYDCATGCVIGSIQRGTHTVGPVEVVPPPRLHGHHLTLPVVFSVSPGAEGLAQPDPCVPTGHPPPNDVFALGTGGLALTPPSWGYSTEAELFQSSGAMLGTPPDLTNVDRISSSLGIGPAPAGGPPYMGPFSPNPTAPAPIPAPPGGPLGTLGLVPTDDIGALSFGCDRGNILVFSVSPTAVGVPGSAVEFHSSLSPVSAGLSTLVPTNGSGDPGSEAAGDLYASTAFPLLFGGVCAGRTPLVVTPSPAGTNALLVDEVFLGLQAPAIMHSAGSLAGGPGSPPEDDLDAVEIEDADNVDAVTNATLAPVPDGLIDTGKFVFFTLKPGSPSLGPATPNDILVSTAPSPGFSFTIYANGLADIGLLPGDVIDALALFDTGAFGGGPNGVLSAGDMALFSLSTGSPSLAGSGTNPNMPGAGPFTPGDVFLTLYPGPPTGGPIVLYAASAALGLLPTDELDALDVAILCPHGPPGGGDGDDSDQDQVPNGCDNCPDIFNPPVPHPLHPNDPNFDEQPDSDGDGLGDVCDPCPFSFGQQDCNCETCSGDMDANLRVNLADLSPWIGALIGAGGNHCADIDGNGVLNSLDISGMISRILANGGQGTACGPCVPRVCEPGKIQENEADCGLNPDGTPNDTTNGGCNFTPDRFTSIPVPAQICATVGYRIMGTSGPNGRDLDWYEVVIPSSRGQDQIGFNWSVTAEFDADLFILKAGTSPDPCATAVGFTTSGPACRPINLFACFDANPGDRFWFVVGPTFDQSPLACGTGYNAGLTEQVCSYGACCQSSGCILTSESSCLLVDGVYQGDGTTCAGVNCPSPPSNDVCVNRIILTSNAIPPGASKFDNGWVVDFDNTFAATDGPAAGQCGTIYKDIWYKYWVPANVPFATSGRVAASTIGTCFNSKVALYRIINNNANSTTQCIFSSGMALGGCSTPFIKSDDPVPLNLSRFAYATGSILSPPNQQLNIRVGGDTEADFGPGQLRVDWIPLASVPHWNSVGGRCCFVTGHCTIAPNQSSQGGLDNCQELGGYFRSTTDFYQGGGSSGAFELTGVGCNTAPCPADGEACFKALDFTALAGQPFGSVTRTTVNQICYRYVVPLGTQVGSRIHLRTSGSNFDTAVACYRGFDSISGECSESTPPGNTLIATNDDCGANLLSCLCLTVVGGAPVSGEVAPGETFYIVVGGHNIWDGGMRPTIDPLLDDCQPAVNARLEISNPASCPP